MISLVIPFKGRADFVIQTLDSVKNQTLLDWECILVDDGTGQGELEMIKMAAGNDRRIKLLNNTSGHGGGNICRNIGWRSATHPLIVFLDSDDLFSPDALERRLGIISQKPGFDFWVFTTRIFFDKPGDTSLLWNELREGGMAADAERFLCIDMPWHTTGPVYTRAFLEKTGGWNESLLSWQDWEMAVRSISLAKRYFKDVRYSPDHYFRKNKYGSVSGRLKTFDYLKSTMKAIVASEPFLLSAGITECRVKDFIHWYFFCLAIQRHPDKHLLKLMLVNPFFGSISRWQYAGLWIGKKLSVRTLGRRLLGPGWLARINPVFQYKSSYQKIELPLSS